MGCECASYDHGNHKRITVAFPLASSERIFSLCSQPQENAASNTSMSYEHEIAFATILSNIGQFLVLKRPEAGTADS